MSTHQQSVQGKVVECDQCGENFLSRNKLFSHIREKHDECKLVTEHKNSTEISTMDGAQCNASHDNVTIVSEDNDWYRVVVKPQGLSTMGSTGLPTLIASNVLLLPGLTESRPHYKKSMPCHRLDRATGGLVLCSNSKPAEIAIKICFRNKLIKKKYRAIVPGRLEPDTGFMNDLIGGKQALTKYSVAHYTRSSRYGWISTVDLWPVTGRRHQLRKHLMLRGHAILGDKRYAKANQWPERIDGKELMLLWALEIDFPHPADADAIIETLKGQLIGPADDSDDDGDDEQQGKASSRHQQTVVHAHADKCEDVVKQQPDDGIGAETGIGANCDVKLGNADHPEKKRCITNSAYEDQIQAQVQAHRGHSSNGNPEGNTTDALDSQSTVLRRDDDVFTSVDSANIVRSCSIDEQITKTSSANHHVRDEVTSKVNDHCLGDDGTVPSLSLDDSMRRITLAIPEPAYYAAFRDYHEKAWQVSQKETS